MALRFRMLALGSALSAAVVAATPVAAQPAVSLPGIATQFSGFDQSRYDPAADTADWRRCRGWGCGYRRGGWRRNRVGAGDVLIGAAIIGGIAAIASANNRREREREVVIVDRTPDFRDRDRRDDRRVERRGTGSAGLDNAVDQCLAAIERDVRVDSVDGVERTARGWQVTGALFNGSSFACRIGNNGRIEDIDYGDGFAALGGGSGAGPANTYAAGVAGDRNDGQWDDQRYADARLAMGGFAQPQARGPDPLLPPTTPFGAGERLPAYPGGPIPGEIIPETIDGDLGN